MNKCDYCGFEDYNLTCLTCCCGKKFCSIKCSKDYHEENNKKMKERGEPK
jgi:hypothetical protein